MAYFFPLLLYLGFGGGLLLLGLNAVPRLRVAQKPVVAAWMSLLTLIWGLAPTAGRWMLSVWAPTSVASGWLVLDITPPIWWGTLLVGSAISGVLWAGLAERNGSLLLGGALLPILFTVTWMALGGGSLLMTLALWAVFDIAWFVVRLVTTPQGERVVWASAVHGAASVLLWTVSLFLLREGTSGLWWLMRPSEPILILLLVASLMRVGFYPFQVVYTETFDRSRPLALVSVMNPVMGAALLYRLISLPGQPALPGWVLGWGCFSVFWAGLKAFSLEGRQATLSAGHAMLLAILTGGVALRSPGAMISGVGVWLACLALLIAARRFHRRDFYLLWPTAVATLFLVGAPPSPLLQLYTGALAAAPWTWRLLLALGFALGVAALLRGLVGRAEGRVRPPRPYLLVSLLSGVVLVGAGLIVTAIREGVVIAGPLAMGVWAGAILVAAVLARWGERVQAAWRRAGPLVALLDLEWFYRAAWQGAENLLGTLRATAEVVEGSGSVLWSVLVLLLVVMVMGRQ